MEELFKKAEEMKKRKIEELENGLERAKELSLNYQIKIYENCLHTVKNEEIKIKHNYVKIFKYDYCGMTRMEDYKRMVPPFVLEELNKATSIGVFNYFEVLTNLESDYVLIGIIIEDGEKNNFKISEW